MSPLQCRAGRALLKLSRSVLAAKANCAISTLRNFELELHSLQINNRRAIQRVLEGEGVEFLLAPEGLKFKGKLIDVLVTARDGRPIAGGVTALRPASISTGHRHLGQQPAKEGAVNTALTVWEDHRPRPS